MGGSISELIGDRLGAMPAGERRAAQALIADYPVTGLKTVAEFASRAGVSGRSGSSTAITAALGARYKNRRPPASKAWQSPG